MYKLNTMSDNRGRLTGPNMKLQERSYEASKRMMLTTKLIETGEKKLVCQSEKQVL